MRPRLLILLLLLLPTYSGKERRLVLGAPDMRAEQIVFDPTDPANRKAGALTFLGGVRLTSRDPAFGSFSALAVEGDRFTMVSDTGSFVRFRMGQDWHPRAIEFGDLPGGPGTSYYKFDRDAESIAIDPATGRIWVGFEVHNQIWRYAPGFARAESHAAPPQMADWGITGGAESMLRLRDGSILVLAESSGWPDQPGRAGIRFTGDPAVGSPRGEPFSYVPPIRTHPSDMTELPNGDLLILNRGFSILDFFTAQIMLVERKAIRAGGVARGKVIARIEAPLIRDNFEGIVAVKQGDSTIVWLLSDDNQEAFEQTLLLKFRLNLPE